jgi:Cft2 family RNA processing exonuclease
VKPHDAGHILGSSWLELTITENGKQILVVFSGDIGRYNQPILKDPEPPSRADYLLCESTYGDRDHPTGSVADELASVINDTVKRGGVIVIPAFAVDRTQMLMYYLRELVNQKRIPVLPVYVDSPMAINVTDLYVRHLEDHDSDYIQEEQHGLGDPLNMKLVHLTRTVDDSKRINNVTTPCRERHGYWRTRAASSGTATARSAKYSAASWVPGARDERPSTAGWSEVHQLVRPAGAGARSSGFDGTAFSACGKERVAAMAFGIYCATSANFPGARPWPSIPCATR